MYSFGPPEWIRWIWNSTFCYSFLSLQLTLFLLKTNTFCICSGYLICRVPAFTFIWSYCGTGSHCSLSSFYRSTGILWFGTCMRHGRRILIHFNIGAIVVMLMGRMWWWDFKMNQIVGIAAMSLNRLTD